MARKKGPRIVEENREWLKGIGAIDDRYKNIPEGMIAKEQRKYEPKKRSSLNSVVANIKLEQIPGVAAVKG